MTSKDLSPTASAARVTVEWLLHAIAVAAVLGIIALLLQPRQDSPRTVQADSQALPTALMQWSFDAPQAIHLRLQQRPDAVSREWLHALQQSGTSLTWEEADGQPVFQPVGIGIEPIADPQQPSRIWLAAAGNDTLELDEIVLPATHPAPSPLAGEGWGEGGIREDAARLAPGTQRPLATPLSPGPSPTRGEGSPYRIAQIAPIKTMTPATLGDARGASVDLAVRPDGIQLQANAHSLASAIPQDKLTLKPVLVIGQPSWETRFVTAALEQHGWVVEARLRLAPERSIESPGEASAIDTQHYSAVLVFDDSAAAYAQAIEAFVNSGGGLMVFGQAAQVPEIRKLLPSAATGLVRDAQKDVDGSNGNPRQQLDLLPLEQLRQDAAVLERDGEYIATAIHRVGDGRIWQTGYRDLWRWQMAGTDDETPEAYQRWLTQALSLVAHGDLEDAQVSLQQIALHDPAPLADWVNRFGLPSAQAATPHTDTGHLQRWVAWLFALACVALLLQWLSRRLRGSA